MKLPRIITSSKRLTANSRLEPIAEPVYNMIIGGRAAGKLTGSINWSKDHDAIIDDEKLSTCGLPFYRFEDKQGNLSALKEFSGMRPVFFISKDKMPPWTENDFFDYHKSKGWTNGATEKV